MRIKFKLRSHGNLMRIILLRIKNLHRNLMRSKCIALAPSERKANLIYIKFRRMHNGKFEICFAYGDFSKRGRLLTSKLMLQGYNVSRLKSPFHKFYGRYNDLVCDYKLPLAHMLDDLFHTIC
jgi:hypothetical protein